MSLGLVECTILFNTNGLRRGLVSGSERLGGDGEVEKDDQIISVGKWGDNVEIPRVQMQCFKAPGS